MAHLSTVFTYQGRLEDGCWPVAGPCDLKFSLFGSQSRVDQVGSTLSRSSVELNDGYSVVEDLDFGASAFQGEARFLEIEVRYPPGTGAYETLNPRRQLTATPYAHCATGAPWSGLSGVPASLTDGNVDWTEVQNRPSGLDDGDDDTTYTPGTGLDFAGTTFSVDTTTVQERGDGDCAAGSSIRAANADGSVVCELDDGEKGGGGDVTAVWAWTGLSGGGDINEVTMYADTTYMQRRVLSACSPGSSIRAFAADGTVTCEPDDTGIGGGNGDITGVYAGNGLSGGGSLGEITLEIMFAGTGSSDWAAKSDHNHDASYVNESQADSVTSAMIDDGTILLSDIGPNECDNDQVIKRTGSAWTCASDETGSGSGSHWSLIGNTGTTPVADFLGTTDNQSLELHVYGSRALRLEPNSGSSPNVIGGYSGNSASGFYGASIGGGGLSGAPNSVSGNMSNISGGGNARVTDDYGTVGGGYGNEAGSNAGTSDDAARATV